MSHEKCAAFTDALAKFLKNKRDLVRKEVRRTRPHHILAGEDHGYSIYGTVLDSLADNGAIGAPTLRKYIKKGQYFVNQADTALGALARGDAKKGSLRYKMFTNIEGSTIPVRKRKNGTIVPDLRNKSKQGLYKQMDRASISAPVKSVAMPLGTGLALVKGDEIMRSFTSKPQEVPYNYEQY